MSNILPGAVWSPVPVGNRAARRKGRGLVGHVAVSGSTNLVPGPLATRSADWHFYLPKVGPAIQYIDMDLQCWASAAGNSSLVAFESQGGLGSAAQIDAEPWTDNQLDWAARILRHLHDTEGVPLQVMPDSLPGSRGFGTHRLGIDPWRVSGGESWSSSRGKQCPGATKHEQRAEIVRRAAGAVQEDDMTPDQANQLQQLYNAVFTGGPSLPGGLPLPQATAFAVWWGTTVTRADENGKAQQVPVIQELADAKSQALAANAALSSVVSEFASAKGLDPAAVGAAVEAAVAKALQNNTVHVDVNVGGQS